MYIRGSVSYCLFDKKVYSTDNRSLSYCLGRYPRFRHTYSLIAGRNLA